MANKSQIVCLSCFKELTGSDKIFSCNKKHNFCAPCGKSMHLQCECYESLQLMTLENAEEIPTNGIVECLGNLLRIWECNWCGEKNDFAEHFIRCHNNIEIFSQFQVSSVPFQNDQVLSAMTLVKAFDSNFIFYYHSNPTTKMIYFILFLLNDAQQPKPESYLYEFMIKSPSENHCKIKFVEKCFTFSDDVIRLRDKEMCAAITFQTIEKYLNEGHIHFSFLIKKNAKESFNIPQIAPTDKKNDAAAKKATNSAPNKGILKINNVRKGPSIPESVKSSGSKEVKKDEAEKDFRDLTKPTVLRQNSNPPEYSSINKMEQEARHLKSPLSCPAINKPEEEFSEPSLTKSDESYHFRNLLCQSYKTPDHKMYRQKYSESCLSKPILRK